MLASPIGRYHPADSLLHRLDARVKSVCLVVLLVSTFAVRTPLELALAFALVCLLVAISRVPAGVVARSSAPIVPFALLVSLFDLFVIKGGGVVWTLGPLVIERAGIWAAIVYGSRLVLAVALGALLLLTTTPTALTDAFESLLSPLGKLGVPVHEIAMVLSLALRFVPILADETQSVLDAQAARGASFEEGGALSRVHALGSVLVPVLAGALRHAENLSRALDARCYEGGDGRTRYHVPHVGPKDAVFAAGCAAWVVLLAAL